MPANAGLTEEQVREFFTTLSNWGKWGPNDQLGALNYITPEKRRRAGAEVREGYSVTLSLPLATRPSLDNPTPVTHLMVQTGARGETGGMVDAPYSADYFAIAPHGLANTHLDALCHVFNQGKMYNGYPASDVNSQGARNGAIDALKDGVVSRGVLIDAPRVLGREWLEPGEEISPADLEAAEKAGNFRVEEGDILFVRTGRHVRQKTKGPWNSFKEGLAGLGATCLPWLHERKVALLGCDGVSDVIPSGFPKVTMPIHTVTIVTMGVHLIDNCNLDDVAATCTARSRWTFLCTIAPLILIRGTASPVNPLAIF